ncbi:tellurite resistance TerB family protein [Actibacterium sp. D379-3]
MFTEFLIRLADPRPDPLSDADARLALGALLVRVAKSDRHYAVEEIRRIDAILTRRYGLSTVEAMKLRARCEKLEQAAPGTQDFAGAVKSAVAYDERSAIVAALWNVVMADGVERPEEAAIFMHACQTLGVDARDLRG